MNGTSSETCEKASVPLFVATSYCDLIWAEVVNSTVGKGSADSLQALLRQLAHFWWLGKCPSVSAKLASGPSLSDKSTNGWDVELLAEFIGHLLDSNMLTLHMLVHYEKPGKWMSWWQNDGIGSLKRNPRSHLDSSFHSYQSILVNEG